MAGVPSGINKMDIAIAPSSYAASEQISSYYDMSKYDRAIFIVSAGTITASGNIAMRLLSGHTSSGTAIAIGTAATMNGTPTSALTVTKASAITLTNGSCGAEYGQTVAINDVTYTFSSTSYSSGLDTGDFDATRYVYSSSAMTYAAGMWNHFAAYINHGTYGCTGVVATAGSTYMSLSATPPGEKVMTVTVSCSELIIYPTQMIGYVECHAAELATSSSQRFVAVGVTPSAIMKLGAVAIRTGARFSPDSTGLVAAYDSAV